MSAVIHTLSELVRINSVNPAYGDGGTEANVVPLVRRFFAAHGIHTFTQEVFPGRENIIAVLPGQGRGRIVLEAHMDTVSIKGMSVPPFDPQIRDGRLFGRGSVDDKAGLAAMMHAASSLKAEGLTPPCEVWMAAVVDEEFSFRGVVKLCEEIQADAAIIAEPTNLRAVIASKGVLRWRIHTRGKAAHSSKPHLGSNALTHLARVILEIDRENVRLASGPAHPLLGPATISVGLAQGGVQVNLVPDHGVIEIDRRLLPGERVDDVLAHIESLLKALREMHPGFVAEMEPPMLVDMALDTAPTQRVVTVAGSVLQEMGLDPTPCGVPFGSDASKLSAAGVPSIVIGPGSIDQAHAADEYVEIAEVERAVQFYRNFLLSFGSGPRERD